MGLIFTEETAKIAIEKNTLTIIDFGANWCGPCRTIEPIIEQLSEKYADKIIIGKVNVDDAPILTAQFAIRNIPAILFFKNGELVDKSIGIVRIQVLEDKIEKLINL